MENASKALMMAGAVLITIMVLGLFMYFFSQISEFPKQQDEIKLQEQIAKFNQEYESYLGRTLYGVDVVTIMNKVISNNERYANSITGRYEVDNAKDKHFIDVEILLKDDVIAYAEEYIEVTESNGLVDTVNYFSGKISGYVNGKGSKKEFQLGTIFEAGKINLLEKSRDENEYFKVPEVEEFFTSAVETCKIKLDRSDIKYDEFNYTMVYSGFRDFKRMYFKCTNIEYDKETSRVSKIYFEQTGVNRKN